VLHTIASRGNYPSMRLHSQEWDGSGGSVHRIVRRGQNVRNSTDRNSPYFRYGAAVADVLLVPLLSLSLVGQVQIAEPLRSYVIFPLALLDTVSVAALLVTGYLGPASPSVKCYWCSGRVAPEVSAWTCTTCHRKWERGSGPDPTKPSPMSPQT
jgi:hypothetical protein